MLKAEKSVFGCGRYKYLDFKLWLQLLLSLLHLLFNLKCLIMRDAMLASKLVSSSEVWYNVIKKEFESSERVDEMFY